MKKYRIAYDYIFSPKMLDKGIYYKGEHISCLAVYMIFKVINKSTGEEIFYTDDQELGFINHNKRYYASDFYQCVIDKDKLFKMIPNEKLFNESDYDVQYEIGDFFKWLEPKDSEQIVVEPLYIKYDEFIDILKNNFNEFNNSNNKPTQSTSSYCIVEINE